MKKILLPLFLMFLAFTSCTSNPNQNTNQTYAQTGVGNQVNVQSNNLPGFNVQAFATLLRTTKDPQALEQQLNTPNNQINNLDIDGDGNIDYIKVVESASGLQVIDASIQSQPVVATLTFNTSTNTVAINGNPNYSGDNNTYLQHYDGNSLTTYLFLAYLLQPHHSYYVPVYHYGYYPGYYHTVHIRSGYSHPYNRTVYHNTYNNNNHVNNVNTNNKVYNNRNSLSNPNQSQRQFNVRSTSTPVKSGGFGNKPSPSPSGFSRPSPPASRSGFGGGRSGFGGGRGRH